MPSNPSDSSTLPAAPLPKPQSSWMNWLSIKIINYLIEYGKRYREKHGIKSDHYLNFLTRQLRIHELPYGLLVKSCPCPAEEALAMMTAHRMGVPAPRVLLYASLGYHKGGYILMTKIPGETLLDVQASLSDQEIYDILDDIGECLQKIRCFSSPFGRAVCGVEGQTLSGRFVPFGECDRLECPEDYHDLVLKHAFPRSEEFENDFASACKIIEKDSSYRVVLAHGDLHPSNIMFKDGRLTGIIDWGQAAWFPEYWDYVNPMSIWQDHWTWAREWMCLVPGGEQYEPERESWKYLSALASHVLF